MPAMAHLQVALNGRRTSSESPAVPASVEALARHAHDAVVAGAASIHVHTIDRAGVESLRPEDVARTLLAIRASCPGVAVGISTGEWIEPDVGERLAAIAAWQVLPDFASVNLHEAGAPLVVEDLAQRGVDLEAGIWYPAVAAAHAGSPLLRACVRLLVEVTEQEQDGALAQLAAIEAALGESDTPPRLLHGESASAWLLVREAARRGSHTRIGIEDVLVRPDGRPAADNAELVTLARDILGI